MLDLFGITFSGLIMLFVIFRATQLDRAMPWFQTVVVPTAEKKRGRYDKPAGRPSR